MKLVLPLPKNLANWRAHHMVKHREKKAYWKRCDNLMYFPDFPLPPKDGPMESVTLAATWYVGNLMDEGNAVHRLKWIEDWLVTRGYIMDDRTANVSLSKPVQFIDRKDPRVEIEIHAVGP